MNTFKKYERLSGKSRIDRLFKEGKSFNVAPFRVVWQLTEEENPCPAQVLIAVPKTHFKKAVERNYIKRRIREAYRKSKAEFYQNLSEMNRKCLFALIYTGREPMKSTELEPKINVILQRLIRDNVKVTG